MPNKLYKNHEPQYRPEECKHDTTFNSVPYPIGLDSEHIICLRLMVCNLCNSARLIGIRNTWYEGVYDEEGRWHPKDPEIIKKWEEFSKENPYAMWIERVEKIPKASVTQL